MLVARLAAGTAADWSRDMSLRVVAVSVPAWGEAGLQWGWFGEAVGESHVSGGAAASAKPMGWKNNINYIL